MEDSYKNKAGGNLSPEKKADHSLKSFAPNASVGLILLMQ